MKANPAIRDWHGQRVWIVGASSGIGAALAQELVQLGAEVAVSSRRPEVLFALYGQQPQVRILPLDANIDADWQRAAGQLRGQWPTLDVVILCQGDYTPLQVQDYDSRRAVHMLESNVLSLYRGLQVILPWLLESGRGGIAIMASVAGYTMLPKAMAYGASKAAAIYLAQSLYYQLAPRGHPVWCINPGFVATRLTAQNDFAMPALLTPQQAARAIVRGFARGRFDIHFPWRFTLWLKLLALLPMRLQHHLLRRLTGV